MKYISLIKGNQGFFITIYFWRPDMQSFLLLTIPTFETCLFIYLHLTFLHRIWDPKGLMLQTVRDHFSTWHPDLAEVSSLLQDLKRGWNEISIHSAYCSFPKSGDLALSLAPLFGYSFLTLLSGIPFLFPAFANITSVNINGFMKF